MFRYLTLLLVFTIVCESWAVPKPMESIENYNVLLLHGAYGHYKKDDDGNIDKSKPQGFFESATIPSANDAEDYLGNANIGRYTDNSRINYWLSKEMFEEPEWIDDKEGVHNSYIYHWRAFSSPPNSSITNAIELGDRTWNKDGKFGKRRALVEEAQEVKAIFLNPSTGQKDSGQVALDTIRRNPDLYRQLASRYILVGHSMGGVVAREYTQNSDYYHQDVDKIITLDSPHEGTGALEMQLDLVGHKWTALQGISSYLVGLSLVYLNMRGDFMAKSVAISSASWATLLGLTNFIAPFYVESNLQDYSEEDPLVKYVNPGKGEKGNISYLKKISPNDSMPMFRLMGGEKSITYSDPFKNVTDWTGLFVPEALTQTMMNFFSQLAESDDVMSTEAFALASKAATMGLVVSAASREQGTSIVPKASSWAENTESLRNSVADVKRWRFDAAPHADAEAWRNVNVVMTAVSAACIAVDVALSWFEGARIAANVAAVAGSSVALSNMLFSLLSEDLIAEISDSHNLPIDNVYDNQNTWRADYSNTVSPIADSFVNDTTINPRIMEDFLYERPFMNLALNDLHTLDTIQNAGLRANRLFEGMRDSLTKLPDSLKKDVDTLSIKRNLLRAEENSVANLNRNCFYIDSKNGVNCAMGLFKSANDLNSTQKDQPLSGLTTPLRFKSEADWSKMGVKVDRWEKVDGLTPEGKDTSDYVPIRHVERYEVPAITVEDWIEKYSFVVDDLMPHRLRQIRMNFNYQEEIAWECDVKKDPDANDACTVYKRSGGGEWAVDSSVGNSGRVRHPVQKNGIFDFVPRDYGYSNLFAILYGVSC